MTVIKDRALLPPRELCRELARDAANALADALKFARAIDADNRMVQMNLATALASVKGALAQFQHEDDMNALDAKLARQRLEQDRELGGQA